MRQTSLSSSGAAGPEGASPDRLKAAARPARIARWAAAAAGLLVIAGVATWQLQRSEYFWRNPLEGAKFTRLTDLEGKEQHCRQCLQGVHNLTNGYANIPPGQTAGVEITLP
jgi:hypothetical protein